MYTVRKLLIIGLYKQKKADFDLFDSRGKQNAVWKQSKNSQKQAETLTHHNHYIQRNNVSFI
jgi:hypothetical protein